MKGEIELLPCPFCGLDLYRRKDDRPNPYAVCKTEECFGATMPVVALDVPGQVERWNVRAENLTLKARVERYERMIGAVETIYFDRHVIHHQRVPVGKPYFIENVDNGKMLDGEFDTALEAFEAITEVEEKQK